MLIATIREIKTHGEKLRIALDKAIVERRVLASNVSSDRTGSRLTLVLTDRFEDIGSVARFTTLVPGILASYSELWDQHDADTYRMRTASLHFFSSGGPDQNPKELILMHAEPLVAPVTWATRTSRMAHWKYGPHLHVKGAPLGLDRCHLHLEAAKLPCGAFASLAKYRETLPQIAQMLIDEMGEYFDAGAAMRT